MKQLQNSLFIALTATVLMTGCGGEDNKNDSPNTSNTNKIIDDKIKIDKNFQASPFLKKLGDNGEELDDGATSWKIVEIPEIGLMIKANNFIDLSKKYTLHEAREYCKNLQFAEFHDWRLPTPDETRTMLDVISYSKIESQYFPSELVYATKNKSFPFFTNYFKPAIKTDETIHYGYGLFYGSGGINSNYYYGDINDTTGKKTPKFSVICVRN